MTGENWKSFYLKLEKVVPILSLTYFIVQKVENAFISCKPLYLGNSNISISNHSIKCTFLLVSKLCIIIENVGFLGFDPKCLM